jgi:hypothetical protein
MKRILCVFCILYVLLNGRISLANATAASQPLHSAAVKVGIPHATHGASPLAIAGIFVLAMCAGLAHMALVAGVIAYQFSRTLSYDPFNEWEDADYFRSLPNALAILSEHGFPTAWPRRCNPWCMNRFQRRLERILEPLLKENVQRFVQQHLSAWRWTISHRNSVAHLLRAREREQAFRLLAIADPKERIALLAALNSRPNGQSYLKDGAIKRKLQPVERLQAVLREHGYTLFVQVDSANRRFQELPRHLSEVPTTKTILH